jgi:hypothetical protein
VLLFYSALTVWLLWPFPLLAGEVILHRGDPIHQLWTLRWIQHALVTDPNSLFAANANYPYDAALALNQPMYTNALLTAPIQALFGNQVLTFNTGVLLSFVLSGAFTALLVQELTGSRWAGLAAGVLYAFAPVRQAHIYHLNLLSSYWTPLLLWTLHRIWKTRGKKQKVTASFLFPLPYSLFPIAFAAQVLSEFYLAIYMALAVAIFLAYQLFTQRWGLTWRTTALLGVAGLISILLTLPVLVPTVRAWSTLGLERSLEEHDRHSARLENYLVTDRKMRFDFGLHERFNHQSGTSGAAEHSLYPGLFALPLATFGVVWALRRGHRDALLYVAIALAAFFLSLGPIIRAGEGPEGIASPLYVWMYEHVPGFSGARVPSRFAILLQLALAVLAGYGVAALQNQEPRTKNQTSAKFKLSFVLGSRSSVPDSQFSMRRRLLAPLIILLLALDFWGPPIRGTRDVVGEPLPEIYQDLAKQPPGAILEYPLMNANEMLPHRYEYYSTFHWRPLVNSVSSIQPQAYIELRDALATFPDPRAVGLLQALDVPYVVVHRYELSGWENWWNRVQQAPNVQVLVEARDLGDVLLKIESGAPPPDLIAARWVDKEGGTRLFLGTDGPVMFDYNHLYERRREQQIGLEYADGRVKWAETALPTYLLWKDIGVEWPDLPEDVTALHIQTTSGTQRVALERAPEPARIDAGPQLTGRPLPESVRTGDTLRCLAYGKGPVGLSGLVLSLNLLDAEGQVRAKQDRFFDEGFAPPEHWPSIGSEPVPCDLPIPSDLPAGRYTFAIGLYDPARGQFVPFADSEGNVGAYWNRPVDVTR